MRTVSPRSFPRAAAVTLPDCGHMLHHEDPQGVAAALAQFFSDSR